MNENAALQTDIPPIWGTLTGIRPAKVAAKLLKSGKSKQATIETLSTEFFVSPDRAAMCVKTAQKAIDLENILTPHDVALYVGIPFCPTRCAYCSFVSNNVERSFKLVEPFLEILLREIEDTARLAGELGLRVISVYFGGGTPTALPTDALEKVMKTLGRAFDFSFIREYTVEAGRPDTVTEEKTAIMVNNGAKRICINPQSMSDEVLSAIGRKHSSQDIHNAVKLVKQTGVLLNMDIIAGLPRDTPDSFKQTLDTVIGFKPENTTVHTLSLKKGSRIMLEGTEIPSGTDVGIMLDYASARLQSRGYEPYYVYRQKYISGGYENVGYSLPGHEGIYNICMMEELCTVLAVGGGGVTKLVSADGRIERIFNAKYPREYILRTDKMEQKIKGIREFYRESR
jgi:oxygen-independent coproporphyrinogen-3 oxidase